MDFADENPELSPPIFVALKQRYQESALIHRVKPELVEKLNDFCMKYADDPDITAPAKNILITMAGAQVIPAISEDPNPALEALKNNYRNGDQYQAAAAQNDLYEAACLGSIDVIKTLIEIATDNGNTGDVEQINEYIRLYEILDNKHNQEVVDFLRGKAAQSAQSILENNAEVVTDEEPPAEHQALAALDNSGLFTDHVRREKLIEFSTMLQERITLKIAEEISGEELETATAEADAEIAGVREEARIQGTRGREMIERGETRAADIHTKAQQELDQAVSEIRARAQAEIDETTASILSTARRKARETASGAKYKGNQIIDAAAAHELEQAWSLALPVKDAFDAHETASKRTQSMLSGQSAALQTFIAKLPVVDEQPETPEVAEEQTSAVHRVEPIVSESVWSLAR